MVLLHPPTTNDLLYDQGVPVTIGNPAFYLVLYLTGVHFRGELQHVADVNEQKF